jgi:hypothetical protein
VYVSAVRISAGDFQLARVTAEYLVVADAKGLDPALLAAREGDEKAELDQLRLAEEPMQPLP